MKRNTYSFKKDIIDYMIWGLTVALLVSFSINNKNLNGGYILLGISIVALLLTAMKRGWKLQCKFGSLQLFVFLFGIFSLISALWALNASYAIEKGITILEILVCITIFYWAFKTQSDPVRDLLRAFMWSGYVITIYAFIFYGTDLIMSVLNNAERLNSAFDNVNVVGMICAVTIVITIYYMMNERLSLTNLFVFPTLLLLLACGSRKALVILIVGVLFLFVFDAIQKHQFTACVKTAFFIIAVVLFLRFFMTLPIFAGIGNRMEGLIALITGRGTIDHSALLRKEYIELGIQVFKEHPIGGVGMGNVRIINAQVTGENTYLHNNYVELLSNGGVIGFVMFYGMYFHVFTQFFKRHIWMKSNSSIVVLLMMLLLIADYGLVSYYSKLTYFYLLLFYLFVEEECRENALSTERTSRIYGS